MHQAVQRLRLLEEHASHRCAALKMIVKSWAVNRSFQRIADKMDSPEEIWAAKPSQAILHACDFLLKPLIAALPRNFAGHPAIRTAYGDELSRLASVGRF